MEVAAELQDLIREDLVSTSTAGQEGQGGGASGHTLYKNALRGQAQVTLVQSGDKLLNGYHAKARHSSDSQCHSFLEPRRHCPSANIQYCSRSRAHRLLCGACNPDSCNLSCS